MKQIFKSTQVKSMLPYFLLALAILGAYKIINEFHIFVTLFGRILTIVTPFFYGFLLAYILNIPCDAVQRLLNKSNIKFIRKRKKAFSILIVYLLFLLVLSLVLNLIVPSVYASIATFVANFNTYYQSAQQFIGYINELEFFRIFGITLSFDEIIAQIQDFGIKNLPSSFSALTGVPSAIIRSFLAFISSVYILHEKQTFKEFLCRVLKAVSDNSTYNFILKYSRQLNDGFKQYIYTQTLDGVILGTIATIELTLLRSQYALTLGIMLGVVNYVPYFGSIIGSLVAIVIVAFTQGIPVAILTAVILLITQQLDGNVIQPKLMGNSFSLSPLLIIVSITVGGAFAGILGMIAAIPIVAVCKDVLYDMLVFFENKKNEENA